VREWVIVERMEACSYCMDAMKGSSQDKIIIYAEFVEALRKVPLVNEASGLVNDDEGKDNHCCGS